MRTYDEWIDERKPDLALPGSSLSKKSEKAVDRWIDEQFRKKNYALLNNSHGIHIIDRCPLDPLTFTGPLLRPKRAKALIKKITDGGGNNIVSGHIIHLDCDMLDVRIRNSLKHKKWPDTEHARLFQAIEEVYGNLERSVICTRGRTANAVAREIAQVIFLTEYSPVDIGQALAQAARGAHET